MRRSIIGLLAVAALAVMTSVTPAAATGSAPNPSRLIGHQVTTFDTAGYSLGGFLESIAADDSGGLVASMSYFTDGDNYTQLFTVRPDGRRTAVGPLWDVGCTAQPMGVTVDDGVAYLVVGNWVAYNESPCPDGTLASPPSGVYRLTRSGYQRVMTLPDTALPNGLMIHDGTMYVTDSMQGYIWVGPEHRPSAPATPWFSSPLLLPNDQSTMGANGIAWHAGSVYVTGYAQAVILRVPVTVRGSAGKAITYASSPTLFHADGIAFDAIGRLWVAVNPDIDWSVPAQAGGGTLAVVGSCGQVTVAHGPGGSTLDYPSLDYPTQVVISKTGVLYVSNGSYFYGTPSIEAFTS